MRIATYGRTLKKLLPPMVRLLELVFVLNNPPLPKPWLLVCVLLKPTLRVAPAEILGPNTLLALIVRPTETLPLLLRTWLRNTPPGPMPCETALLDWKFALRLRVSVLLPNKPARRRVLVKFKLPA